MLWLVIPGAGIACILHFWASLRALGSRKADLPPERYVGPLGRSLFGRQTATVGKATPCLNLQPCMPRLVRLLLTVPTVPSLTFFLPVQGTFCKAELLSVCLNLFGWILGASHAYHMASGAQQTEITTTQFVAGGIQSVPSVGTMTQAPRFAQILKLPPQVLGVPRLVWTGR